MEPIIENLNNTEITDNNENSTRTRKIKSKFSILKRNAEVEASKNLQLSSCFSHINEIGKEIGLEIWKIIDNDTVQKIPKMNHSIFETNKTYLLLNTSFFDNTMTIKNYNIHFWVGELSINEENIHFCNDRIEELERIVIKNQSFETSNGTQPILYREYQGKESDIFMSYFKTYGGPRYVPPLKLTPSSSNNSGGTSTTESKYQLYHLKGRRNIRVKQIEISAKNLNSGDVFVLSCDDFIYQWNGSESSRLEKGKGLDLTVRLRDEKSARAKIIVMDENNNDNEYPEFWKRLNGNKSDIQPSSAGGDDFDYEKKSIEQIKLYQINNQNHDEVHLNIIEPIGEVYSTQQLKTEHCYILDCETQLFIWLGKKSTSEEKSLATSNAMDLLHDDKRPSWTPIIKVSQGAEISLFKDHFKKGSWGEFIEKDFDKKVTGKIAPKQQQEKINVDQLHNPEKYQLDKEVRKSTIPTHHHIDERHKGQVRVWHVRNRDKFEINESEFGLFYSQSCYLVLFTLTSIDGSKNSILYYWQGRFSKSEDKGASALLAKDIGKEINSACIHVRTVQNKEPKHFLEHFQGRMVVFKGARPSNDQLSFDQVSLNGLYHVRGTDNIDTHSIQVEQSISSLDSNDSFIIANKDKSSFIWVGKYSDERQAAIQISENVFKGYQFTVINENQEPLEFWESIQEGTSSLPNKEYYRNLRTVEQEKKTRLFQCSNNSGVFKVFEIHDFSQDDLDSDDVMILDNQKQVFVWIGKDSSDTEKSMSMETATEYLLNAPNDRKDDPIYKIDDGNEPLEFISNFHAWDSNKLKEDSYKSKLDSILKGSNHIGQPIVLPPHGGVQLKPSSNRVINHSNTPTPKPTTPTFKVNLKPSPTPVVSNTTPTPVAVVKPVTPTAVATPTSAPKSNITNFYPLSVLQKKPLPSDVDATQIHLHLSDDDFLTTFKVTKDAFNALPVWKQKNLRTSNNLF